MNAARDERVPTPEAPTATVRRPSLAVHYMRYSAANLLLLLASFISFPVLARLLDNTEFGIMGYFNTWILVGIALIKLGGQHAIVRFYPHDADVRQLRHFGTNLVLLPLGLSLSVWAIVAAGLAGWHWLGQKEFSPVFWCVVLIIPLMVTASLIQMVARASERSGVVTVTKVAGRAAELALVLGLVIFVERSALSVFGGRLLGAALLLGYFVYWASRNLQFSRRAIDVAAMGGALAYGLPLMANEFAFAVLSAIDRVVLKELTGEFAMVGIYTVGYALAAHISLFMNTTLSEAFVPVANRTYGSEGDDGVRALKERVLLPMTYASLGVAAMVLALGQDLLVALAGPGKAASGEVFVVVGTMMALYPLFEISGYGLLLRKRSMTVLALTFSAAALNIAVNFVLIPLYGYMGAAWATVIAYGALATASCVFCPRALLRFPDLRALVTAAAFAVLLLVVVKDSDLFGVSGAWSRLLVGGCLFLGVYALPVWALDARLRAVLPRWRPAAA